jgi:hypothetical protein
VFLIGCEKAEQIWWKMAEQNADEGAASARRKFVNVEEGVRVVPQVGEV